jgi:Uma2 family endonuclease
MAATAARPRSRASRAEIAPSRRAPRKKLTYEEFLDWCDEDTWAEWVDGEVIVLSPASAPHQQLMKFLITLFELFTRTFDLGEVLTAPMQMRLGQVRSGREPDLLFIAKERLSLLKHTYLDGPADLAIEIVSPESTRRDRIEKFAEYEAAGVREYWLVDYEHQDAAFYALGEDGRYHRLPTDEQGVVRSTVVPGFWLRVDWLWQSPPPTLQAARDLGLLPAGPGSGA